MTREGAVRHRAMRLSGTAADVALLLARLLLAVLFLGGAAQKALDPTAVMSLLAGKGLPMALVWPALLFSLCAGLALVAGLGVGPVALLLAAYCGATSVFHWIPDDPWQMTIFVKNWAIAGGCLALAVAGPGRFAVRPGPRPEPRRR